MFRTVSYLNHSGFLLEADAFVLVFDFFTDPAQRLAAFENCGKPLSFFVSHAHADHWNPDIFTFRNTVPSHYFCDRSLETEARELLAANPRAVLHLLDANSVLKEGELADSGLTAVLTAPSTDEGVAFWIETAETGTSIYHAGDLNDWDWSDTEGAAVERRYREILQELKTRVAGRADMQLDGPQLAFVPLDRRLGPKALEGVKIFLEYFRPTYLAPMHLNGGLELPAELAAYCAAQEGLKKVRVLELTRAGQNFALT